jgi:hypothetical protein
MRLWFEKVFKPTIFMSGPTQSSLYKCVNFFKSGFVTYLDLLQLDHVTVSISENNYIQKFALRIMFHFIIEVITCTYYNNTYI